MKERLPLVLNRTLGPSDMRVSNRAGMLEAIRRNSGISRAELAEVTHLTQPAVSGIVLELMEMGLVREAGLNRSDSGRPRRAAGDCSRCLLCRRRGPCSLRHRRQCR